MNFPDQLFSNIPHKDEKMARDLQMLKESNLKKKKKEVQESVQESSKWGRRDSLLASGEQVYSINSRNFPNKKKRVYVLRSTKYFFSDNVCQKTVE